MLEVSKKTCTGCRKKLPETKDYFNAQKNGKNGLTSKCKECKRVYALKNAEKVAQHKRDWYLRNKESILVEAKERKEETNEQRRKRRASNPEKYRNKEREYWNKNPDKKKANNKRYYNNHKEEFLKKCKIYYQKNSETVKERTKEWAKNNPQRNKELNRLKWHKYRSRLSKLDFQYTKKEWECCKEHFNHKCSYCGSDEDLTREHFVPVIKGGEFTRNNIIPACGSCNYSKSDRDFFEWYPNKEFYSKGREKKIMEYLNYNKNKTQQLTLTI